MDVASVIAAVGSFVVSERVIKAKATVVFVALGIVAYDLTIHSNDPVSLRVYRGPAVLGIAFICTAYSLRTWRRNNCACDELLFLPGTMYDAHITRTSDGLRNVPLNVRANLYNSSSFSRLANLEETTVCDEDGSSSELETELTPISRNRPLNIPETSMEETSFNEPHLYDQGARWKIKTFICKRKQSPGSSVATEPIDSTSTWTHDEVSQNTTSKNTSPNPKGFMRLFFTSPTLESNEYAPSGPIVASAGLDLLLPVLINFHLFMMASSSRKESTSNPSHPKNIFPSTLGFSNEENMVFSTPSLQQSNSSTINYYIDNDVQSTKSTIPPQVLPLIFLSILFFRSIFPQKARGRFWRAVSSLVRAPFKPVSFRDSFLSEVLTSMTRTLQDLCFAIFYYFSTLYGVLFGDLDIHNSGSSLQHNRVLHNFVLPTIAFLPLFIGYLQTLRQAYDDQRRWPHLGNAFKYLTADLIIVYAMNHAEDSKKSSEHGKNTLSLTEPLIRSRLWILAFVAAVLYQIWWDVWMDWELFVICSSPSPNDILKESDLDYTDSDESIALLQTSPSKSLLVKLINGYNIQLRPKRLFKNAKFYWKVFIVNALLRFTWMLAFIPAFYVNKETGDLVQTNSVDLGSAVGLALSIAELIRRCLWGLLKVEIETIKMMDPSFRRESRWNSGKKIDYKYPRIFRSKRVEVPKPQGKFSIQGNLRSRPDVIVLNDNFHHVMVGKEESRDLEKSSLAESQEDSHLSMTISSESTTKLSTPALHMISTETMKRTAHRKMVRRVFALELCCWALIYVLGSLWASSFMILNL